LWLPQGGIEVAYAIQKPQKPGKMQLKLQWNVHEINIAA